MVRFSGFRLPGVVGLCALACAGGVVRGQCELGWVNDFGGASTPVEDDTPPPDWETIVDTLVSYDPDGEGPLAARLVAGGKFTHMGGVAMPAIAQWDRNDWSPLGIFYTDDETTRVVDMVVHDDDGDGPMQPALYAATYGVFLDSAMTQYGTVVRWDGEAWSLVNDVHDGTSPSLPFAMTYYDDGDGLMMYVASNYNMLSRYENGVWREVWPSVPGIPLARKLIPTRVGNRRVLAVLGQYSLHCSDVPCARCALGWSGEIGDGQTFTGYYFMGFGLNGRVRDAVNFDPDGDGPEPESLYVVGAFTTVSNDPTGQVQLPARNIARWDGSVWSGVGPEPDRRWFFNGMNALTVFDDGTGPALVAGGFMHRTNPELIHGVAKWTGSEWKPLGIVFGDDDYRGPNDPSNLTLNLSQIRDFATLPDSTGGRTLFTSGVFRYADGFPAEFIARLARPFARGDADGDGFVDFGDVAAVLEHWGTRHKERTGPGDPNGTAEVDFADITFVLTHFGASCP